MRWIMTTEERPFEEVALSNNNTTAIPIDLGEEKQSIHGFGACFSELGRDALMKLPQETRLEAMEELFSPEYMGFNFCRVPIGANDFASSWYSLNENEGDLAMEHFSIERDKQCILPFIREAKKFSPDLELFASPWSPPTWMKQPPVYNFGRLKNTDENLDAYALYFQKFLEAFAAEGAAVQRLCVQNEVFADQKFPSCLWDGTQMRDFIRDHLGPRLAENGLDTEIWLGTINGPFFDFEMGNWHGQSFNDFIGTVMMDEKAASYIKGFALQWGGKHILSEIEAQYPDVEIIQSECECGDGSNEYKSIFYVYNLMWNYLRAGATAFVYWNIALEADAVSTWGWKQNSLLSVDAKDGTLKHNPEFYIMKHLSSFVKPGAHLLTTSGRWAANSMAFRNEDGSLVYIVVNPFEEIINVTIDGQTFALAPRSLSTMVL
ncbi:MAG: glycoside hydrolase family 30 protein [Clostridiales bacterium]|nr:glycoside hydrolase family 30 protein [Clostridiales bacterium]